MVLGLVMPMALLATGAALAEPATSACEQGEVGNKGACEDAKMNLAAPAHGVPSRVCRAGFAPVGGLCFTEARGPDSFANALTDCISLRARVADYVYQFRPDRTAVRFGGASPSL